MRALVERDIANELPNGYASKNIATAVVLALVLHVVFVGVFMLVGSHTAAEDKNKLAEKNPAPAAAAKSDDAAKADKERIDKTLGAPPAKAEGDKPAAAQAKDGEKPPPTQVDTARPGDIPDRPDVDFK